MKKVSVIVPAYNSHNTLARCLGSLVNQTLDDIEIVVINDASTDDTPEIMERCRQQFPDKVIVVDGKVNRGSGGARNQGFDVATGEYIGMVDSDDYVASNMFELLYKKAIEGNFDIVDSGFYSEASDKAVLYTGDNVTGVLDDSKRNILIAGGGYLVTKIFKRELFESPRIRMREKVRCLEDTEILLYMFLRAESIGNVKEILYNYCNNSGSATKTMDLKLYYDSIYGAIQATYDKCRELPGYEGCKEVIEYAMVNMYSYGVNRCLYDRITKLGASEKYVKGYFEGISGDEKVMLENLAKLKAKVTTLDYDENKEVTKRIAPLDIEIMRRCDELFGL